MKPTLTIALLAGSVAGFAAGMLAAGLGRGSAATGSPVDPAPLERSEQGGVTRGELQHAADEIAQLRTHLDELGTRLAWLEAERPAMRREVESIAEVADPETEADPLTELASALGTPGARLPDALRADMAQIVQDVRAAEREERLEARAEEELERNEARLAELVIALGLTPTQTDLMRTQMNAYSKKRAELLESARENGELYSVRDAMRSLRDESRDAVAAILDPMQLELYRDQEDDRRGRRRGPDDERRGEDR